MFSNVHNTRQTHVGNAALEKVNYFEYLGTQIQCDGSDEADVRHRMAIAQTTCGSLSNIWEPPPTVSGIETGNLPIDIGTFVRGMDVDCCSDSQYQRLQQPMPPRHHWPGLSAHGYSTVFDLLCAIRQRRLRYIGHILRTPQNRVVRRALMALTATGTNYPEGSLLVDCQTIPFENIEALAHNGVARIFVWGGGTRPVSHAYLPTLRH